MIFKRTLSLFIDLAVALIPALAVLFVSDFDFGLTVVIIFAIGLTTELIITKGKSLGLITCKIGAQNKSGYPAGTLELIAYYLALSVLLFNAFNYITAAVIALLVCIPFPVFDGKYSSGIDILFGIHWVEDA